MSRKITALLTGICVTAMGLLADTKTQTGSTLFLVGQLYILACYFIKED